MANFPNGADVRLLVARDLLSQLFPGAAGKQLDLLLRSIDLDLKVPLRGDASSTPDLTVTVGPGLVENTESGRKKSIPHIQNVIPDFVAGSLVFPVNTGGTITVTPGADLALNCPIGEYVKILVSLDSSGDLVVSHGTPDPVEANAVVPAPPSNTMPAFYVRIFNDSGVIQPIEQEHIVQLTGSGGGGGSGVDVGFAQEEAVANGATSHTVTFPSALAGVNYVPQAYLVNYTDPNPQYQEVVITNKTTGGFTANWNAPLDTGNYLLAYIVPTVQMQMGEAEVPNGVDTLTVSLPIALAGTNYVVLANLVNYVDGSPQFQTVIPVTKTATTFTVEWNSLTDSGNYKLAFFVAQYQ